MADRARMVGITPYLMLESGDAAAKFYTEVLGAVQTFIRRSEDGRVAHMTLALNGGTLMLSEVPEWGRWSTLPRGPGGVVGWLAIETEDCDATFARATAAGATVDVAPEDTPWGDRYARFRDPFGQLWSISSAPRKK